MNLTLKPETAQFIDQQIKSGRFPSAEALIEAAVSEFRDIQDLDPETVSAINEGLDQADQGQGVDLDTFRARVLQTAHFEMTGEFHVIITPRASRDLERIHGSIMRDSPLNADGIAKRILDAMDSLNCFPAVRLSCRSIPIFENPSAASQ